MPREAEACRRRGARGHPRFPSRHSHPAGRPRDHPGRLRPSRPGRRARVEQHPGCEKVPCAPRPTGAWGVPEGLGGTGTALVSPKEHRALPGRPPCPGQGLGLAGLRSTPQIQGKIKVRNTRSLTGGLSPAACAGPCPAPPRGALRCFPESQEESPRSQTHVTWPRAPPRSPLKLCPAPHAPRPHTPHLHAHPPLRTLIHTPAHAHSHFLAQAASPTMHFWAV